MQKEGIGMCVAALLLAGCIFSEEKPVVGGPDTGNNSPVDMSAPSDMNGADLASNNDSRPDLPPPFDGGTDQGTDTGSDAGTPDMARDMAPDMMPAEQPWLIVASHDIALGGTPPVSAPTDISTLSIGFLLGYADQLSDSAVFGWYSSDSAMPLDTANFPGAENLSVGVTSTSEGGFGAFTGTNKFFGVQFEPDVAAGPSWTATIVDEHTSSSTYESVATGVERDTTYMLTTYETTFGRRDIEPMLLDATGLGFVSDATLNGSDLTGIELAGGGASSGRRLLGAGGLGSNYALYNLQFDINVSMFWEVTEYDCGFSTTYPRIVPIRNQWVMARRPTLDGDALVVGDCVVPGDALQADLELVPGTNNVTDFDLAKEDVAAGPGIGVAWLEGTQLFFGRATLNGANRTATILNAMEIPGALGTRVRTAYNPVRQQWGVVTTSASGSRLHIIERNPNF